MVLAANVKITLLQNPQHSANKEEKYIYINNFLNKLYLTKFLSDLYRILTKHDVNILANMIKGGN